METTVNIITLAYSKPFVGAVFSPGGRIETSGEVLGIFRALPRHLWRHLVFPWLEGSSV